MKQYLFILTISVLALTLRLSNIQGVGLIFWDEANYLNEAKYLRGTGGQPLSLAKPTYSALVAVSQKLFGETDYAGQLVSAFMGAVTIPVIFFLTKQLFSRKIAILASLLFALIPLHIIFSRLTLSDTTALFFLTLAILLSNLFKSPKMSLLSGFIAGLAYTSNLKLIFIPFLFIFLFRNNLKTLVIWLISFIATLFLWEIPHLISHSFPSYFFQLLTLANDGATIGLTDLSFYPYVIITYLSWPIIILATASLFFKRSKNTVFLLFWILLFTIPLFFNIQKAPRLISFLPIPVSILAALALNYVLEKKIFKEIFLKVIIILLIISPATISILKNINLHSGQKNLNLSFTQPKSQKIITTQLPVTKFYLPNFDIVEFPNNDLNSLRKLFDNGYHYLVVDNQAYASFKDTELLRRIESDLEPIKTFDDNAKANAQFFLEHAQVRKATLIQMLTLQEELNQKRGKYLKIYNLGDFF